MPEPARPDALRACPLQVKRAAAFNNKKVNFVITWFFRDNDGDAVPDSWCYRCAAHCSDGSAPLSSQHDLPTSTLLPSSPHSCTAHSQLLAAPPALSRHHLPFYLTLQVALRL